MTDPALRTPPQSIPAEACVLGSMLLSPDALIEAAAEIDPAWFYRPAHVTIFEALRKMSGEGVAVDIPLLRDRLGGELEKIGGLDYLVELVTGTPNASSISHYAEIIKDKHTKRQLIIAAGLISDTAYNDNVTATEASGSACSLVQDAVSHQQGERQSSGGSAMTEMLDHMEAVRSGTIPSALPTGFGGLDAILDGGGIQEGDLVVLAARPKKGKSIVAGDIVRNVCGGGHGVLHISGEMRRRELMKRHAGAMTGVFTSKISKAYKLTEDDIGKLYQAQVQMDSWKYEVIDQSMTISAIAAAAKRQNSRWDGGLSLVVVDYLHLMVPDNFGAGREQQVGLMMRQCKVAAQNMGVPWLVLSQFNREAHGSRPEVNQFRDSGQIEEHANTAIILDLDSDKNYDEANWAAGGPYKHLLMAVALQRSGVMPGWSNPVSRKLRFCLTRTEEFLPTAE